MDERKKLASLFESAVRDAIVIGQKDKDLKYYPGYWNRMIDEQGGVGAAKRLLTLPISDGFTFLWKKHRLDLSVELYMLVPAFQSLFTQEELDKARKRLEDASFDIEMGLAKVQGRLCL